MTSLLTKTPGWGFEGIWSNPPQVGTVHDGQQASRRGLLTGDLIVACNGQPTRGRSRSEVLGELKMRPLTLKIGRALDANASGRTRTTRPSSLPEGDDK